jgi:hypothetical protein
MADHDSEIDKIVRRLDSIELRLSRMEESLSTVNTDIPYNTIAEAPANEPFLSSDPAAEEETGLESQIGRFGLAWLGNIVLLFGITILTQYMMNLGHQYLSVIFGYAAAVSIFFLAKYLKKSNVHLAFMFRMNAQILLFYVTVRLHFFSDSPLISNKAISLILLLFIIGYQAYWSIQNRSQAFAAITVIFALVTAAIGDTTHFTLPLVTLTSAAIIYSYHRFNWEPLLVVTVFLTYISFSLWLLGNPLMGHPLQLIAEQHFGVIYLFLLGASYSSILFFRKDDTSTDDYLIGVTIANGILFTLILFLVVVRFFSTDYVSLFAGITVCCLVYSTIFHSRSDWNFASAFYALYGFMAMTISLYGLYGFPKVYLLLSVQSLLVVSMALWFRNRLIVVMNSLLFLTIMLVYLFSSKSINSVNFSFAFISLISARIINWKSSRLKIETDIMRNLYMIEGFFMMLYAMAQAVPKQFVTLSWTLAALLYFLVSILLKNIKYRYMALGTMICAAFYLFLVDLARIEIIYRILALLFLAVISIGISIYYTNRIKKPES